MKIETSYEVKELKDGKSAQLLLSIIIDGNPVGGQIVALSGPKNDVKDYVNNELSWTDLEQRWGFKK